jgi:hypothetical protein
LLFRLGFYTKSWIGESARKTKRNMTKNKLKWVYRGEDLNIFLIRKKIQATPGTQ